QSPVFVIVAPPTSTASPAAPAAITAPSRTPASRAAGTLVRGRQPRYAHDRRSSTRPTSHVASAKPTAPESELHASDQAGPGSGPRRTALVTLAVRVRSCASPPRWISVNPANSASARRPQRFPSPAALPTANAVTG